MCIDGTIRFVLYLLCLNAPTIAFPFYCKDYLGFRALLMGGSSSVPESIANKVNEEQIRKEVGEAPVVVYTKSGCGYCDLAKELLGRERIHYQEHDLAQKEREDPEEAKRYVNGLVYVSRHKLVPQVFICGNFIGGYTELAKLREANLLKDEILRCSDE